MSGDLGSAIGRGLDALERAGCGPRRSGKGLQARCPAHDNRNHKLSINEGEDGRVLVHRFAGCDLKRVPRTLDLGASDLFASDHRSRPERS